MAFFKEFRQKLRVKKWRKLRVQLARLESQIYSLETGLMDDGIDGEVVYNLSAILSNTRRQRNQTLRRLRELEHKEKIRVQA